MRLGRFTCIPIAEALPAAAEALQALSQDTGVPLVTLRSLSPRELAQNTGLPQREAEFARQRDFDDTFFFAGASDAEVGGFLEEGRKRNIQFRQHGVLWSAAIGRSVQRCMRELTKLYERALRPQKRRFQLCQSASQRPGGRNRRCLMSAKNHGSRKTVRQAQVGSSKAASSAVCRGPGTRGPGPCGSLAAPN